MRTRITACLSVGFSPVTRSEVLAQDPFTVPLRINMGEEYGPVDSNGNTWLGDPGEGVGNDVLGIRPDAGGGNRAIVNWSLAALQANPDPVIALGFDPTNPDLSCELVGQEASLTWGPAALRAIVRVELVTRESIVDSTAGTIYDTVNNSRSRRCSGLDGNRCS